MHNGEIHKDPATDGWSLTVAMLGQGGLPEALRPAPRRPVTVTSTTASGSAVFRLAPTVHVLDRPTPRTAAISWSDPGACHYGYQIRDLVPARHEGRCVLSGTDIRLGESVYIPREDEPPPLNSGAMIAAAYVDA